MPFSTDIQADDNGAKRRRADYVLLQYLKETGGAEEHELDHGIRAIHDRLLSESISSPFYFRIGGSNGPNSRELNDAIDRCLHFDRIELINESEYAVTERGEEYLADEPTLERHGIDEQFRETIPELVEESL